MDDKFNFFTYEQLDPVVRYLNQTGKGLIDYSALHNLIPELNRLGGYALQRAKQAEADALHWRDRALKAESQISK